MRPFALVISPRATREILAAKRWRYEHLGAARAGELDEALAASFDRVQTFPGIGPPDWVRGRWSKTRRRLILGQTGYVLLYRVHEKAELIEVLSLRHEKQRPTRL